MAVSAGPTVVHLPGHLHLTSQTTVAVLRGFLPERSWSTKGWCRSRTVCCHSRVHNHCTWGQKKRFR